MRDVLNTVGHSSSLTAQLKMARDALVAQQTALNTISHNVANVNTEGYHRQRTVLQAKQPIGGVPGMLGTGVDVQKIDRAYNSIVTRQERVDVASKEHWDTEYNLLLRVEESLNEMTDSGIRNSLDEFWNSWQDLANDTDTITSRANVVSKADDLGRAFQDSYTNMDTLRKEINIEIEESRNTINSYAKKIAELNESIYTVNSRMQGPNDLMDQRDQLVKELAGLVNIQLTEEDNGGMNIYLGNETLVFRNEAREVSYLADTTSTNGKTGGSLIWADNSNELQINDGKIYGLISTRDTITNQLSSLDELATTIRDQVNALHVQGIGRDGSTNTTFFRTDTDGATGLDVRLELKADLSKIATSRISATGDNSLAHEMFELQNAKPFEGSEATISDFYQAIASDIGNAVSNAGQKREAAIAGLQQSEAWQQQYTGVSLDEEMSDMITVQYAFSAASKMAQTIDQMLNTIINMT
jgi:flagellar hook-associated protein 1